MVGQATARLEPFPGAGFRPCGDTAISTCARSGGRLWPHLAKLPTTGLHVLDAGCGAGRWVLELAARRPQWQVQGIDRDRGTITAAERTRQRLGVENVSFLQCDYFAFEPQRRFDAVLAVSSAHYQAERGEGAQLFQRYARWLKPGGQHHSPGHAMGGTQPFFQLVTPSPALPRLFLVRGAVAEL